MIYNFLSVYGIYYPSGTIETRAKWRIYMVIGGYTWLNMDIGGYTWLYMVIGGYRGLHMVIHGYWWL